MACVDGFSNSSVSKATWAEKLKIQIWSSNIASGPRQLGPATYA